MPYIHISTTVEIEDEQAESLKERIGEAIELLPGKSEQWLMLRFDEEQTMYFQGDDDDCVYVEVKLYGGENPAAFSKLTGALTEIIEEELEVDPSRIYVAYFTTHHWGYEGENF